MVNDLGKAIAAMLETSQIAQPQNVIPLIQMAKGQHEIEKRLTTIYFISVIVKAITFWLTPSFFPVLQSLPPHTFKKY